MKTTSLLLILISIISPSIVRAQIDLNKLRNTARTIDDATGASDLMKKKLVARMSESRKEFEESSFTYAVSLSDNAGLYENEEKLGKYKKYMLEYINSKDQQENTPAEKASNMMEAGEMFYASGHYHLAESSFSGAKLIYENEGDTSSVLFARLVSNIALLQHTTGRYEASEKNSVHALRLRKNLFNKPSEIYAASVNNLAVLYKDLGRYSESENLIAEALQLNEQTIGKKSIPYGLSLNNQGMLFLEMGRYSEAEKCLKSALEILDQAQRGKSSNYIRLMMNVAVLYQEMRRYDESEATLLQAIKLKERKLGKNHPDYAHLLSNLAGLYMVMEKYEKVESLLQDALKIYEKKFGKEHPSYASALYNLGNYYRITSRFSEAESALKECSQIRKNVLGPDHPELLDVKESIGLLYWQSQRKQEAYTALKEVLDQTMEHINKYFAPLSEAEKTRYWDKMRTRFRHFYSFASTATEVPGITKDLLFYHVNTKALLLNSSTKVKHQILNGTDKALKKDYLRWLDQREKLSYYYSLPKQQLQEENINLDSLEKEANNLEKQLSARSLIFNQGYKKDLVNPVQIAKYLKTHEAAVEIIHYNKFDKFLEAESGYMALIITATNSANPFIVVLENGSDLEKKYYAYYRNCIRQKMEDTKSREMFWEKIASAIPAAAKTIFISADGVYNQINLNTIRDNSGKYLIDQKTLICLTNSKDLIEMRGSKQQIPARSAAIFAFPFYGPSGSISSLPGTKAEGDNIGKQLRTAGYKVSLLKETQATEEKVRDLDNIGILHFATHGFFLKEPDNPDKEFIFGINAGKSTEEPLLRSGLLLANAEAAMNQESSSGILTAYEVMNLQLEKTGIVVLSACETGLGDVKNGEGVYGLQRAFKVAGADAIIMSLWKVDDAATQLLMTSFYKYFISSGDRVKAFRQAQLELKKKFPEPVYWGAFVLVE